MATATPGYDKETNKFTVVGEKKSPGKILYDMFHSKEHKLRDLAKKTGLPASKVFKAMFDRNTEESDFLEERMTEIDNTTFVFDLTPISAEAPVVPDVTPPVAGKAEGTSNIVTITFTDVNHLNTNTIPSTSQFTVMAGDERINVAKIQIPKNTNTVKLILSSQIKFGDVLSVAYTQPGSKNNQLQDTAKNIIGDFAIDITNTTPDPNPVPPSGDQTPPADGENTTPPDGTPPADGGQPTT